MSEDVFRWVVAVGVMLAAIASVSHAVVLAILLRAAREAGKAGKDVQTKLQPLVQQLETVLGTSGKVLESSGKVVEASIAMVEENRPRVAAFTADAVVVAQTARLQAERMSELFDEANARIKARIAQIDDTVGRTVTQVEHASDTVKSAATRPAREINGIMAGVRAALNTYAQGGRHNSPDHITQDEEMFI